MLKLNVVHSCPHTGSTRGVMHINHKVLTTLAGAVWEKEEWMAFLIGTRSQDGLQVIVTDLRVPYQTRSHGNCELVHHEELTPDIVGVVHSHHSMGAFFSQTDHTQLNPRFATSIVVAQPKHAGDNEHWLLGFQYKAEGRAPLPCGSIGVVDFTVQPFPMVDNWPVTVTAGHGEPTKASLYYCPHTTKESTGMNEITSSKCGLSSTEPRRAYFGSEANAFLTEVVQQTKASPKWVANQWDGRQYVNDKRHNQGKRYPFQSGPWDEDAFLRSWSEYGCYGGD